MDEAPRGGCRNTLLGILLMIIGTGICLSAIYVVVDVRCAAEASDWIPYYPNSEIVNQTYTQIRPFGMGTTIVDLYSPDDANTVRRWYIETRRNLSPRSKTGTDIEQTSKLSSGLAQMNYRVSDTADGNGSTIRLSSVCGWS